MLNLLAQNPLLDLLVYGGLLFAFHICVYRSPRGCVLIAVLALAKMIHTSGVNSDIFWVGFNTFAFTCLLLGLYLTRRSPNFFWLFSFLLTIKVIDLSLYAWLIEQKSWFYVVAIAADGLVLWMIDQRSILVGWIAKYTRGETQRLAQAAKPHQRLAYQEVTLMIIYWVAIALNILTLGEDLLYRYTDWKFGLFYELYPNIKLPLSLLELLILLNIATGHAISLVGMKRVR